jgi:hypothetical protein
MAGTGWETSSMSDITDEASAMVMELTPEMREKYADVLTTPIFTSGNADHQMTTQAQMEEFLRGLDGQEDDMYVYSIGKTQKGRDFSLKISCGRVIAAATVLKGSITIDGVSLTVSGLGDDWLQVDIIPTTASETTLGSLRIGSKVNLESDVLGRYARRAEEMENTKSSGGTLTMEMLAENGFL